MKFDLLIKKNMLIILGIELDTFQSNRVDLIKFT